MKEWNEIRGYFLRIDSKALGKSFWEVMWMTLIALCPLVINIVIYWIKLGDFSAAAEAKIIPGEVLSYCLSFIAPSLYLLIKAQGTAYRLPHLHIFSIVAFIIYALILVLYLIAKNNWEKEINTEKHNLDVYFCLTLVFLLTTLLLRVYATYHRAKMVDWNARRNEQQNEFNSRFSESINS